MDSCLISLIIPVYNVENYLCRCLDSAINQTYKNIEIIIVNDGSTDGSLSIINRYASEDSRIKVINQKNYGLGEARNSGISIASGDYIAFMDSDDWMELDFLEVMYNEAEKSSADITVCGHNMIYNDFSIKKCLKSGIYTGKNALKSIISDKDIKSFAWDKLYKTYLFTQNNIEYPKSMYFEDMATTFKLFYYAEKVSVIDKCLYNYYQRKGSISKELSVKRICDYMSVTDIMKNFLKYKGIFLEYTNEYRVLCVKMLLSSVMNLIVIFGMTRKFNTFRLIFYFNKKTFLSLHEGNGIENTDKKETSEAKQYI